MAPSQSRPVSQREVMTRGPARHEYQGQAGYDDRLKKLVGWPLDPEQNLYA